MKTFLRALIVLLLVAGCARPDEPEAGPPARRSASAALAELTEEAWQRQIDESLYLQIKLDRPIRSFPDWTPEHEAEAVAWARSLLERLDVIPDDELSHQDALTAAILRWDVENRVELAPYYWLNFPYTPYVGGFSFTYAHQALAVQRLESVDQTAGYLELVEEYAELIDQLRRHAEGQIEREIFAPKAALPGIVGLLRAHRDGAPGAVGVEPERMQELSEEERRAFEDAVTRAIEQRVQPAFDALLAIFETETYRNKAPDAVGLAQYPDGEAFYRRLVRSNTTLEVTPEELHEMGKRSVERLAAEREAIRRELGFDGLQEDFEEDLRREPRFLARAPAEVEARYMEYVARMEPLVPDLFSTLPEAPYGVRRLPPEAEPGMTFGYYEAPTPQDPVGIYYYNGSNLDQRSLLQAGPLIYHELIPGHHFQIALQNENASLPPYRRESYSSVAFIEGWANYAAYLAREQGLLDDPHERYAWALFDTFFSVRLVVDTGMNLMGWSLEEARDYMRRHLFESDTQIASESLRYSTDLPGQALAYKAGFEKLLELRQLSRQLAGESFDLRAFHDAVLGSGSMPLLVLERHLERTFGDEGTPP